MAVEVRLPTVLRAHADGAASVEASGATVGEVFTELVGAYPGLEGQLVDDAGHAAQVRQRVRERRRHPVPRPARHQGRRRRRHLDPARRRRGLTYRPRAAVKMESILDLIGNTPLVGVHALQPEPRRPDLRQARGPEPGRFVEGPHRAEDDRARRARRRAPAGRHDPRAVVGQHRDRPRARGEAARLPPPRRDARERQRRAPPAARDLRRRDHAEPGEEGSNGAIRRAQQIVADEPELRLPLPVRQPGQPARALRGHRPRDLARLPRGRRVRRRASGRAAR